jgi:putative salt-induced outer membrane protein YdiY
MYDGLYRSDPRRGTIAADAGQEKGTPDKKGTERMQKLAGIFFCLALGWAGAVAAQTEAKPDGAWRGSLGVFVSSASGNNESVSAGLSAEAVRQRDYDKLVGSVQSLYGRRETDGVSELTASRFRARTRYDRDISDRLYGFVGDDLEKNKLNDLKWRHSPSVGAGLHLRKTETFTFDVFAGYSYNREELYSGTKRSFDEALLGEETTHKLSETISFQQRLSYYYNLSDSSEYRVVFDAGLLASVVDQWKLTVNLSARYQSNPPLGVQKSDTLLFTGLQYGWGPK